VFFDPLGSPRQNVAGDLLALWMQKRVRHLFAQPSSRLALLGVSMSWERRLGCLGNLAAVGTVNLTWVSDGLSLGYQDSDWQLFADPDAPQFHSRPRLSARRDQIRHLLRPLPGI
jgi:hypothetical protein